MHQRWIHIHMFQALTYQDTQIHIILSANWYQELEGLLERLIKRGAVITTNDTSNGNTWQYRKTNTSEYEYQTKNHGKKVSGGWNGISTFQWKHNIT